MKNLFLTLFLSAAFLSCKKTDAPGCSYTTPNNVATAAEITYLQNYMTSTTTVATQHQSGVFYSITDPGTGSNPNVCSNITVNYTGRILGGPIFDPTYSTPAKFMLGQLIIGWQRVLPVLKSGGTITLYIPPSLGYGPNNVYNNQGVLIIPGNSYLAFEINLVDVQ